MFLSKLFTKTLHQPPKDEESKNAKLLTQAGFIYKNSSGIYTFLPLGLRVIEKIAKIIREEMAELGAQEIFMPALIEKRYFDATKRWGVDIGFEVRGKKDKKANFSLGWTHEEVLTEIVSKYVSSYKDLPFSAYQIQVKFRNEPRAKSGLLRVREFLMKDLYSFHSSEEDFLKFYEKVKNAYQKIFSRCGLKTIYTLAGGGAFTSGNTHEFQVRAKVGEDKIFVCSKCEYAENSEISKLKEGSKCPKCQGLVKKENSIEVGNIFPLGTKYSEAFNLKFLDKDGKKKFVIMGSYGIGLGRTMATVVEIYNDNKGIIWPETIAPFAIHLITLEEKEKEGEKIYESLKNSGIEVLYDDRKNLSPGEKFADADLIGCPLRLIISKKTLEKNSIEIKKRKEKEGKLIKIEKLRQEILKELKE